MGTHKDLSVWKKAMDLAAQVYSLTAQFPKEELYGLTSQIRRSAVSIPSNIAEGAARQTKKEFRNFLHIAQGSLSELDTQLELARRLDYIDEKTQRSLDERMDRIDKTITGLIRHLNKT